MLVASLYFTESPLDWSPSSMSLCRNRTWRPGRYWGDFHLLEMIYTPHLELRCIRKRSRAAFLLLFLWIGLGSLVTHAYR